MKIIRLGVIALWIVLLGIVGVSAQSTTPEVTDEPDLIGSTWLLVLMSGQDHATLVLRNSGITLRFESENRISGNGGCNGYSGNYALGGDGEIAFSEVISTLRACADNSMTTQESIYLGALGSVTNYEISEQRLTLRITDLEALHFVRMDENPLAGTSWELIDEVPTGAEATPEGVDRPITLTFEAEGQAVGNGGCNGYSATYRLSGINISFGDVVSTRMACAGDVMQREQEFFAALSDATQYGLTSDRLYIRSEDGSRLAFAKVETMTLTVTPLSGAPGSEVQVMGSGFAPNSEIVIGFGRLEGDVYEPVGEAQTDADGSFTATVMIPATANSAETWVFMAAVPGTARAVSDAFAVTGS